jgi:hypothetical protein
MQVTDLGISRSKQPGVKGGHNMPGGLGVKQFTAHMFCTVQHLHHRFRIVTVGHKDLRTMDRG